MNDPAWGDTIGMLAWLFGCVAIFLVLLLAGKAVAWWLSRHPKISRVFFVALVGLGVATVAAIGATVFAFFRYGFRGGSPIWGIDRAGFIIGAAAMAGLIVGALWAFLFVRRILQMRKE